jgi:hypothetical protein
VRLSWAQVRPQAADAETDQPVTTHTAFLDVGPGIKVAAAWFAVDPVTAYWAVRFYAEHPDARAELADGRAVERVRRGDLLDQDGR